MKLIGACALLLAAAAVQAQAPSQQSAPCSDFDAYVNGRWAASVELPPDRGRIGSFDTLRVANARVLQAALAELAAEPTRQSTPGLKLLATYYRSGMDEAAITARGLAPLVKPLAAINTVTRDGLPALMGQLARLQVAAPLVLSVGSDAKDPSRHVLQVQQGGLGLPDRDDYAGADERARRLLQAYRAHAQRLLQAADAPADEATLDALIAFETQLSLNAASRTQRRDPGAAYNRVTLAGLHVMGPAVDWKAWLSGYGLNPETLGPEGALIVGQPGFVRSVAALINEAPLPTWRTYLRVRLLDATAEYLPAPLAASAFTWRGTAQRGLKAPPPRVEQVIAAIGGNFGSLPLAETLGELFAAKAFSPQAQARAQQMLADIKAAMRQRIKHLAWMSAPTKALARDKLERMTAKVGVPARWRVYDGLSLDPADYAGNLLRVNTWFTDQRLAELARPVDRERWNTSPHIVNAFAATDSNQIIFPAGILQPPFFDAEADDASNYGGIGIVIGHEITHHFDDRGRQFDSSGGLRDWWQPQDALAYQARADRVAQLYSRYEPLPGVAINGRLTLGENISDMAGMQIAYDGLQLALSRQRASGRPAGVVDGLTPEQRFFTAAALVWRSKSRPEALVNQLRTDTHSPGRWRVLVPMAHIPAFAQAFGCKAGDGMVAMEPVTVW